MNAVARMKFETRGRSAQACAVWPLGRVSTGREVEGLVGCDYFRGGSCSGRVRPQTSDIDLLVRNAQVGSARWCFMFAISGATPQFVA